MAPRVAFALCLLASLLTLTSAFSFPLFPWQPRSSRRAQRGLVQVAHGLGASAIVPATVTQPSAADGAVTWSTTKKASRPKAKCTNYKTATTIGVTSEADFSARTAQTIPPNTTVIFILQNDISLTSPLIITADDACTIITSPSTQWPGFNVSYPGDDQPALVVSGSNNVFSVNVGWSTGVSSSSAACSYSSEAFADDSTSVCPAILITASFGVQIGGGVVAGRVDVHRSMKVRIDSLSLTGPESHDVSPGLVRVRMSGYGPSLLQSEVLITNNDLSGADVAVELQQGAVGVVVANNRLHGFTTAAVSCGSGRAWAGDCMLNSISANVILAPPPASSDLPSAGILFNSGWINPGNQALCNYVVGSDVCYMLDTASSGVTISGGGCINASIGAVVTGKRNVLTYVAVKNPALAPYQLSCEYLDSLQCAADAADWEALRATYYNTAAIKTAYPYLSTFCGQKTAYGAFPCNPAGSLNATTTGNCSGLPTENKVDVLQAWGTTVFNKTDACDGVTVMGKINSLTSLYFRKPSTAGFRNFPRDDLALQPTSQVWLTRPAYLNCPRNLQGPRKFSLSSFYWNFNIPQPTGFDTVTSMTTAHLTAPQS